MQAHRARHGAQTHDACPTCDWQNWSLQVTSVLVACYLLCRETASERCTQWTSTYVHLHVAFCSSSLLLLLESTVAKPKASVRYLWHCCEPGCLQSQCKNKKRGSDHACREDLAPASATVLECQCAHNVPQTNLHVQISAKLDALAAGYDEEMSAIRTQVRPGLF